jgi:asparagine synthase (glutamine-hydrolysing)
MCGIAGFYNINGHNVEQSRNVIKEMADLLIHRGPDEEGFYIDDHIALGHRRLSIIDLSSGQQPMSAAEGRYQIVFNGEIYNFQQIRKQLITLGYAFATNSDTEVILQAYREWDSDCVSHFNGMFAFALWDKQERTLFVSRDRVGKKPLYYTWDGSRFSFSSELKSLCIDNVLAQRQINYQALDCYFSFGYIPSPLTIFSEVKKLEPAHSLVIAENGVNKERYWQLDVIPDDSINLAEAVEKFEELLDDATRCRLMSEVPLGAFLSGGLDSTLVVSSMAKVMDKPVLTNSIGFTGFPDELHLAELVSREFRTNHREHTLTPDCSSILSQIAYHFDEPFADSSAIPTWYVCKMARNNVTVAVSGDGGDESFGGYTFRYLPHMYEARLRQRLPTALRSLAFSLLGSAWPASARLPKPLRLKTILENLSVSDAEAFYNDLVWLRNDIRENVYSDWFYKELRGYNPYEQVSPIYNKIFKDQGGSGANISAIMRAQYTDVNFYMTEDVLVKVDRMSMAHSLEVRSPLLDYRIIEFAATLPDNLKLDKNKGKIVLRDMASRRLPRDILKQPKKGFAAPIADWLRTDLREHMELAISATNGLITETLKRKTLHQLWKEHLNGSRDHSVFLWSVLMLDMWEKHALR